MKYWLYFCGLSFFFVACNSDANLPNVNHIEVDVKIKRFDSALANLDTLALSSGYQNLVERFPNLTTLLFTQIIPIQKKGPLNLDTLHHFLTNPFVRNALNATQSTFPNLKQQEKKIAKAMQYYLHYFPNATIPNIYSGITDYTYQTFIFNDGNKDGICASLDLYLGSDYPYKNIDPKNPAFSQYISKRYDKSYLTKKVVELLIEDQIGTIQGKKLLDHMIYHGKKWYLINKLIPTEHDSILTEFTAEQLEWCNENELAIWSYFLDNNLMYETNQQKIKTFVFESPSSFGMPEEAPGRTAQYIGWKMVTRFMEQTGSTIEELIKEENTNILKLSKYKPKRK